MSYVAVVKALYDYDAQDPETELSFKEDSILYVIEKEDDDWWKAKLKDEAGVTDGAVGLIPATYVEELPPMNTTRALYAYDSTSPEELSMGEDATMQVYSVEDDWLLVRIPDGGEMLGFVPRTYCEPLDESAEVEVPDADEAQAEIEAQRAAEEQREKDEKLRQMRLKDKVETWSISEMEGKKKKKGTLGVGNGAVFFASDTDKMTPVKQYPITDLLSVSQPSHKDLQLSFSALPAPLHFHCGSSDEARAILAKLESSKAAAGEALKTVEAEAAVLSEPEEVPEPSPAIEPKAVRFAPSEPTSPVAAAGVGLESALVLYDFDAQGEDELTVRENEAVTVVDKENDEWWLVRNSAGQEGVVPAQYVQMGEGGAVETADASQEDEYEAEQAREAEAAAALEAQRQREREEKAAQRRAIEHAAREKQRQEEEDRKMALQLEQRERDKQERRARRNEEEARARREIEIEERREAARRLEPPKISKRPSGGDVHAAAANLPSRGRNLPDRPPENSRPKPHAGRIRTWSDKTGQFKVDAEYLGLNGNKIRLHKLNGVIIEVPMEKMSMEDVQLIRRHESRKARAAMESAAGEDDDVPLGSRSRRHGSKSEESRARHVPAEEPIPAAAMEMPKPRKPRFDWFAFFLEAGCDIDDCTRYASNFERDRIDEEILPELERSTMRSLGLKEGDVIRVKKAIDNKFAKKTPEQEAQIKQDEEYARQLQVYENSGSKGPAPVPPPGLFTGPGGKLANNTRRGRPEKKSTGADTVDASALAAATNQLSKMSTGSSLTPPVTVSPPPEPAAPAAPAAPLITGFDDDAWTIKPSTSKPSSPAPPLASTSPAPPAPPPAPTPPPAQAVSSVATGTDSLLAQIQALRPASTGAPASADFDRLSQMVGQQRSPSAPVQPMQTGSSTFSNPSAYGLGMQNTGQPLSQMMTGQPQFQNGPRGPVAPVPSNEGLLNPMQPQQTGMFVPTRGSPMGAGSPQGMMPQQTGYQGMMMQPTGYAQGFQQGYGGQPQQLQQNYTGFPGGMQQPQSSFNAIANVGPPPPPAQDGNKFAPGNIFAAMKKADFGKPEEQQPQSSNKYDALRPLATGYNGAPGMMPQQTGMGMGMGINTGMIGGMMPQQTGMMNPGGGQMGMGGMMPQMTGYNPQFMQNQQNPYGQYR